MEVVIIIGIDDLCIYVLVVGVYKLLVLINCCDQEMLLDSVFFDY